MEFTITCPTDGNIEVTLEDVSRVILKDADKVEIVFSCPNCGSQIPLTLRVPNLLKAAIESSEDDSDAKPVLQPVKAQSVEPVEVAEDDDPRIQAYCEYFRRQLARVNCVEDVLDETDDA